MSRAPYILGKASSPFSREQKIEDSTVGWRCVNPVLEARVGLDSNPQTAENLSREQGISRADQDAYALRSQQRAERARERGVFRAELTPVEAGTPRQPRTVDQDEHPRPGTTLEQLGALKPLLGPGTTITAGNSSGINDGACALLIVSGAGAARRGLTPIARIAGMASVGVPPRTMGVGPVGAIRKLLAILQWSLDQVQVVEINEAFAAQVLACTRALGLPDDAGFVNPNGGAIALGHPLGASGARLCMTAALELNRLGARRALVSLCVGVGQGLALALEAC
jgi:3-oxoadipyl-CoA thiolase